MGNDSTRKPESTPAPDGAQALLKGEYLPNTPATDVAEARHSGVKIAVSDVTQPIDSSNSTTDVALARHRSRVIIYREDGVEYLVIDGKRLYRDLYLGRQMELSRPRDLRKTIARLIKRGDITSDQFLLMDDDEVSSYYVDADAAMSLAFNSNAGDTKSRVMRLVSSIRGIEEADTPAMSLKDALSGFDRIITFMASKSAPRAAKLAKLPLLGCYARAAGLLVPDVSEMIGAEIPRLPGV